MIPLLRGRITGSYSWSGDYLDSYIVPRGRIWSMAYVNETIFAVGDDENIYRFPVLFNE